ncbi:hypothetical protein ACJ41O_007658 [Fusarium nematophilum]
MRPLPSFYMNTASDPDPVSSAAISTSFRACTSALIPAHVSLASAHMTLSRHYKSSTLYFTARKHYGAALRSVNRDLSVSGSEPKNETLVSVMLLGMIEDIVCEGQTKKAVHMAGISKLFDIVGRRVLVNVDDTSLNGWIFTQLQLPALTRKEDTSCLAIPESELNPAIRMALAVTRVGQFYRMSKRITDPKEPALTRGEKRERLVAVVEQAMSITSELAAIAEAIPPPLRPQQVPDKRSANPQEQHLVCFSARWTACKWSLYTVILVLFFDRMLSCSRLLIQLDETYSTVTPETHVARTAAVIAETQLKRMVDMLCAAMSFLMGEVDSHSEPLPMPQRQRVIMYHLVWPLGVVIACPLSSRGQVEDCQARLDMVRDMHGIKLAAFTPDLARDLMS